MARDRANIRIDLWADDDWRKLSVGAQHLYLLLLTHSTLSYAGVADWRAGRLAAVTSGRTADDIRASAAELAAAAFIYTDEDTEEVLIRSFTRHDGVIKHPKLHVSMGNDFAGIASNRIKQYVAFELQKLHKEEPDYALWKHPKVQTILKADALSLKATCPSQAIEKAKDSNTDHMPTTTATATEDKSSPPDEEAKKPETKIPKDWAPTSSHIERARAKGVDVLAQAEAFKLHAETHDRRAASWNAAFTSWLIKSKPTLSLASPSSPWSKEFHQ